jgi:signal transduction histidine kinase
VKDARAVLRSVDTDRLWQTAVACRRIAGTFDLPDILKDVTDEACGIIGTHLGEVLLRLDDDWTHAHRYAHVSYRYAAFQGCDTPVDGSGIYALVYEENRPMRLARGELEQHPRWRAFSSYGSKHMPLNGWLAAPLRNEQREAVGVLQLSDKFRGDFDEQDEALLMELAEAGSTAIANWQRYRTMSETIEALARANEARDQFLALMSHEIRGPLTIIAGYGKMLRTRRLRGMTRNAALAEIEAEGEHLIRIFNNLITLAQLERGAGLDLEPILVSRIAERVARDFRRMHPERGVAAVSVEPEVMAMGVPDYVEQILLNLLSNADKYSPPGEPVDISVRRLGSEVVVSVTDRGFGIEEDEMGRLFDMFYRSGRLSERAGGLGLGLAVCARLAQAQSGRIWAERRPGGGSVFSFTLRGLDGVEE